VEERFAVLGLASARWPGGRYAYLAFYNLIYVVSLALIVFAFVRTLGGNTLTERAGQRFKSLSGIIMLELSMVLTVALALLNNVMVSPTPARIMPGLTALAMWLTREGRKRAD